MGRRCFERAKVRPRSWYLFFKGWKRDRVRDWRQRYSVRGEGGGEGHIVAMVREGSPVVNHWPIIHEISPGSSAKTYFCLRAQSLKGGGGGEGTACWLAKREYFLPRNNSSLSRVDPLSGFYLTSLEQAAVHTKRKEVTTVCVRITRTVNGGACEWTLKIYRVAKGFFFNIGRLNWDNREFVSYTRSQTYVASGLVQEKTSWG